MVLNTGSEDAASAFPALSLFDPMLAAAERMLNDEIKSAHEGLKGHTLLVLARATRSLRSVRLLFEAGYAMDAQSVGRTITELAIDLAYILKEDTEDRMRLYFGYEHIKTWHLVKGWEAWQSVRFRSPARETAEAHYESVRAMYPDEYCWAGKDADGKKISLRRRAGAVDLLGFYDMAYSEGCAASHSGPETLRGAYSFDAELSTITIQGGPTTPESGTVLWTALVGYFMIMVTIRTHFALTSYETEHDELFAVLGALGQDAASAS